MDKNSVAIATLTWARDAQEEAVLKTALAQLASLDLPVFITDGGSGTAFLEFLNGFPTFSVQSAGEKGAWSQTKSSLKQAYQAGTSFVFYTEPDKTAFFTEHLPAFLAEVQVNEHTGLVLAARSAAGFATFPVFQQGTETTINACCAEVIGRAFDYTYGPFLLRRELVPHLNVLPANIGWGWRPYLFALARRLGFSVTARTGDYFCPPLQRQDDAAERLYRIRQLGQNIEGLLLAATAAL